MHDVTFDRDRSWAAIRELCASAGKTRATTKGNVLPSVQAFAGMLAEHWPSAHVFEVRTCEDLPRAD